MLSIEASPKMQGSNCDYCPVADRVEEPPGGSHGGRIMLINQQSNVYMDVTMMGYGIFIYVVSKFDFREYICETETKC